MRARARALPLVDPRAAANVRSVARDADVTTATSSVTSNATVEPRKPVARTKRLRDPRAAGNATADAATGATSEGANNVTSDAVSNATLDAVNASSDVAANAASMPDAASMPNAVPPDDPDKPVQPSLFR